MIMTEIELRNAVCMQARAWLGRKEADGSHREIIELYNSIRPLPCGYRMSYADPWCAAFVSAVAQKCSLTNIIYPECGCDRMIALYKLHGRWIENDAYGPSPGDVIFYDWDDDGRGDNAGSSDHVGLVVDVNGSGITVIEGNKSDMVAYRTIQQNGRYIRGYGIPNYAAVAQAQNDNHGEDSSAPADASAQNDTGEHQSGGASELPTESLPVVRYGSIGETVRAVQLLLIGRGFRCGPDGADGEFGDNTYTAVLRYQIAKGLTPGGVVGPMTWAALLGVTV